MGGNQVFILLEAGALYVAQAGLQHYSTEGVSQVQGLQAYTTMASLCPLQILPNSPFLDQRFFMPSTNTAGRCYRWSFSRSSFLFPSCPLWLQRTETLSSQVPLFCCFPFLDAAAPLSLPQFSFVSVSPLSLFRLFSHNCMPSSFLHPLSICQKQKCSYVWGNSVCTQKKNPVSSISLKQTHSAGCKGN